MFQELSIFSIIKGQYQAILLSIETFKNNKKKKIRSKWLKKKESETGDNYYYNKTEKVSTKYEFYVT